MDGSVPTRAGGLSLASSSLGLTVGCSPRCHVTTSVTYSRLTDLTHFSFFLPSHLFILTVVTFFETFYSSLRILLLSCRCLSGFLFCLSAATTPFATRSILPSSHLIFFFISSFITGYATSFCILFVI